MATLDDLPSEILLNIFKLSQNLISIRSLNYRFCKLVEELGTLTVVFDHEKGNIDQGLKTFLRSEFKWKSFKFDLRKEFHYDLQKEFFVNRGTQISKLNLSGYEYQYPLFDILGYTSSLVSLELFQIKLPRRYTFEKLRTLKIVSTNFEQLSMIEAGNLEELELMKSIWITEIYPLVGFPLIRKIIDGITNFPTIKTLKMQNIKIYYKVLPDTPVVKLFNLKNMIFNKCSMFGFINFVNRCGVSQLSQLHILESDIELTSSSEFHIEEMVVRKYYSEESMIEENRFSVNLLKFNGSSNALKWLLRKIKHLKKVDLDKTTEHCTYINYTCVFDFHLKYLHLLHCTSEDPIRLNFPFSDGFTLDQESLQILIEFLDKNIENICAINIGSTKMFLNGGCITPLTVRTLIDYINQSKNNRCRITFGMS